ncbi:MAG: hypothetical protein IKP91_01860 [Bacteroidaceae bacterium]|nr:hypothetical protein [Bacteroidaceae bacterium]
MDIAATLCVCSCITSRNATLSSGSQSINGHPQMVFVEGLVKHDTIANKYSMQLLSMEIVDGQTKQLPHGHDLDPEKGFNYVLFGHGPSPIAQYGMENPLHKRLEYADENGKLETTEVKSAEADFYLRIPTTSLVEKIEFRYKKRVLLTLQL